MIVNEFGEQMWPSMNNPMGGFLLVDSDDAFDMLVGGLVCKTVIPCCRPMASAVFECLWQAEYILVFHSSSSGLLRRIFDCLCLFQNDSCI